MDKIDLVLQGPANEYTYGVANYYLQAEFVDNVIVSTWMENDFRPEFLDERIIPIYSPAIKYTGIHNRNRQIETSLVGLRRVATEFTVKLRSDQKIRLDSLEMMNGFYNKNKEGDFGRNQICVTSLFPDYPFYPCDHVFWGNTEDLIDLFSLSHDLSSGPEEYDYAHMRSETYIGANYAARFNEKVAWMLEAPQKYLTDEAPKRREAMELSDNLTPRLFKPFPRIHFDWPKHYGFDYFEFENPYGEIFGSLV